MATATKKPVAAKAVAVEPKLRIRVRAYENKVLDASVKQIIDTAANQVGVNPNTAKTVAAMESGLRPEAKAKGTSAVGLFGMT